MTHTPDASFRLDFGLSDREAFFIGQIISQRGAMEHEVFLQTLLTFDQSEKERPEVPRELATLQLTTLLALWKERVIDHAPGERADVLRLQFDEIGRLKDARDALVHGMWRWAHGTLGRISTVRVRRKHVITMHFTLDDLKDLSDRLANVNFRIRYPGGVPDFAQARAEQGGAVCRRGLAILTDNSLRDDWLTASPPSRPPE
jgi:hypothetical protein